MLTFQCDNHDRRVTELVVGVRRRHRTVTSGILTVLVSLHMGVALCRRVAATWRCRRPVASGTLSEVDGETEYVGDGVRSRYLVRLRVHVRVPRALGRVARHGRRDRASERRKGTGVLHYRRDKVSPVYWRWMLRNCASGVTVGRLGDERRMLVHVANVDNLYRIYDPGLRQLCRVYLSTRLSMSVVPTLAYLSIQFCKMIRTVRVALS